jgi:OPA family glycerol-3-phosphate transporter-like MFS transporter
MTDSAEAQTQKIRVWRVRILATTWLSYAGFYFCRKNFAIAKSSLLTSLQIDKSDLAHVVSAYLMAYMLGQFLTAILSRKVASRTLLLAGMGISLGCNVVFGFSYLAGPAGYWPLLMFNIVNGFAQSTGWPSNIGILGNWLPRQERGRIMAAWATCYQLGSILAKGFATLMLAVASAAWSFWGASIVMLGVWILFFFLERDSPEDVGLPSLVEEVEVSVTPEAAASHAESGGPWKRQVLLSITFMGCVYFVFKFLRYALDSWSPLALTELFGLTEASAGYISTAFDWVGFLGVLFAGWASDRFFEGRRYQILVWMTVGMFLSFGFLAFVGVKSVLLFGIGLSLCGFMLMGPDSLLSGVGAIDVGGRRQAVLAAGIINGLGSIGPIFQEEIIGHMLDTGGYDSVFNMLIGVSVLGIIGTLYLAKRSRSGQSSL